MKQTTKWTRNLYPNGTKPQRFSARTAFNMKHYITDIEQTHQGDCMSPRCYYAATSSRCIHCKGTHASEDHHLSISIPSLPNTGRTVLLLPQEQDNPSEPNTDSLNEYKTMQKPLPSQQSAYLASLWMPHLHQNSLPRRAPPPLLTQSAPSTDANNLQRFTAYLWTTTTTRYIPGSTPPRTSHQSSPRLMTTPTDKLSNNLGMNTAASRHSRGLST